MHESEKSSSYPVAARLKRVMQLFRDCLDEQLRPHGITAAQLQILAAVDREPGISGASLARNCMVTPQTTQVLLRTIEANGWIRRARHPANERILLATLTISGKKILDRSRASIGQIYTQMLSGFDPGEVRVIEELLGRCAANLQSAVPSKPAS